MAVGLLVAVLAACIYTAQDEKLQELYKLLLHPFELLLGAVIGLITGEPCDGDGIATRCRSQRLGVSI